MIKGIILQHIRFLEMFKWFMDREILKTRHKTPILYNSEREAKECVRRVLRKGIKTMFIKNGFPSRTTYGSINVRFTRDQMNDLRRNNVNLHRLRVDWYRTNGYINLDNYRIDGANITELLNQIEGDLKEVSKVIQAGVFERAEKIRNPKKYEAEKKAKEQMLFNDALKRRLR